MTTSAQPRARSRCKVTDCEAVHFSNGFCVTHRQQWVRGARSEDGAQLREMRTHHAAHGNDCDVDGCGREADAKGFCTQHYRQWYRGQRSDEGALVVQIKDYAPDKYCKMEGCPEPVRRRGFCKGHSWQLRSTRNGPGTGGSLAYGDGWRVDADGYVWVKLVQHYAQLHRKGWALMHRVEMELHLGRRLRKGEVVHHKDGDRTYNHIANLELLTIATHAPGHAVDVLGALALLEDYVHLGMEDADVVLGHLTTLAGRLCSTAHDRRKR